jgi:hypothetical protein
MRPKRSSGTPAPAIKPTRPTHLGSSQKTGQTHVSKHWRRSLAISASWLTAAAAVLLMTPVAKSQCPIPLYSGLQGPVSVVRSSTGDLLVAESGSPAPNTGQISIVDPGGNRRALLSGLPSGINDTGTVSGPGGIFLRGRTLYVAISAGDAAVEGLTPGSIVVNPTPSSPLFSSVLALHFGRDEENTTGGFILTFHDQKALAKGRKVELSNGDGDK